VATAVCRPNEAIEEKQASPVGTNADVDGISGILAMTLARRFVSEILLGKETSELSDGEWTEFCRTIDADSDELAVSQLVLKAYTIRNPEGPGSIPDLNDECVAWLPVSATDVNLPPPQHSRTGPARPADSTLEPIALETCGPAASDGNDQWIAATGVASPSSFHGSALGFLDTSIATPVVHLDQGQSNRTTSKRSHTRSRLDSLNNRRRERWLTVASWVRNFGAIILLFVAWQLWGTAITQHQSQQALKSQFQAKVHHSFNSATFRLIPVNVRLTDPPNGTVMAQLQIPKIGLSQFVVSGTDEGDLAKGPGHYIGTAQPGQAGNVAIAGHRTTHGAPFNRLAELTIGDPIYLTTSSGQRLTYIVAAAPVAVSPKDVTVLNNFGDDRITLTTCNPEYSAVQRLIVVGAYLPPGASHPEHLAKGAGDPYAMAPTEVTGWHTGLIPIVLLEVGALVALGLLYRRLSKAFGKEGRWIILVPVWSALLLALFETLTNFLPAAV
jgi:LPXTG-site transpeptidase (sortase) family protein